MYTETENRNPVEAGALDNDAAEVFFERVSDIVNAGAISVMISIGHRSGLFDVLAQQEPETSQTIATHSGLNERYVREWLAVMVTAGIVAYEPQAQTYYLPRTHAACLTRDAALGNIAVFAQHVPLMGIMQDQTLACLESGGGTRYGDYPCFHQIMAEDSEQTVVNSLFESVIPLVDGVEERLECGIDVLDAGCGKGLALLKMAERYPQSRFMGYDLCADAVGEANHAAEARNLDNLIFRVKDMTGFDERERYDLITSFDAVHDQRDPQGLITGIHGALKPSGVYLMQDIGGSARLENNLDFPMAPLLYSISCSHCVPISIGQGGDGLGTMWGWETAQMMLEESGFNSIEHHVLAHDPTNIWFVSQKEQYDA